MAVTYWDSYKQKYPKWCKYYKQVLEDFWYEEGNAEPYCIGYVCFCLTYIIKRESKHIRELDIDEICEKKNEIAYWKWHIVATTRNDFLLYKVKEYIINKRELELLNEMQNFIYLC